MRLPITALVPVLTGALLAGCAATPAQLAHDQAAATTRQQKLAARLAGFTPGKPSDCILNYPQVHSEAHGSTILYVANRNLIYANETTGGCETMERGDYLVTVSNEGQLCRGDIGRTFQPEVRIPTGSCALGAFTPYRRN